MLIKKHYHFAIESVGISGRTNRSSLKKLYRYAKAHVSINGWVSEEFLCNVGVRQGCPLGPLLFSLFINDL